MEYWGHQEFLLARWGIKGSRNRLEEWAELATLELALEQVGPNPINGRQSQAQPVGDDPYVTPQLHSSKARPILAQEILLDPVPMLITPAWRYQGASPSSRSSGGGGRLISYCSTDTRTQPWQPASGEGIGRDEGASSWSLSFSPSAPQAPA